MVATDHVVPDAAAKYTVDMEDAPMFQIMFPDDESYRRGNEIMRTICHGRMSYTIRVLPLKGPTFNEWGCFTYDDPTFQSNLMKGIRRILLSKASPIGYVRLQDHTRIELRHAEKWTEDEFELSEHQRDDLEWHEHILELNVEVMTKKEPTMEADEEKEAEKKTMKRRRTEDDDDEEEKTDSPLKKVLTLPSRLFKALTRRRTLG